MQLPHMWNDELGLTRLTAASGWRILFIHVVKGITVRNIHRAYNCSQ